MTSTQPKNGGYTLGTRKLHLTTTIEDAIEEQRTLSFALQSYLGTTLSDHDP